METRIYYSISHINNSQKQNQRKLIFNQYLEIGGRLQPNFANFNLHFLSKYGCVREASSNTRNESVHPLISKRRQVR